MREIKFRAWDRNKMDSFRMKNNLSLNSAYFSQETLRGIEVMQYTGICDKNGKEIYEGDIVKGVVEFPQFLTGDNDENCNIRMAGTVFYDYSGFSLKAIQHLCDGDRDGMVNYFSFIGHDGETFEQLEVIGNIYETPELLK